MLCEITSESHVVELQLVRLLVNNQLTSDDMSHELTMLVYPLDTGVMCYLFAVNMRSN